MSLYRALVSTPDVAACSCACMLVHKESTAHMPFDFTIIQSNSLQLLGFLDLGCQPSALVSTKVGCIQFQLKGVCLHVCVCVCVCVTSSKGTKRDSTMRLQLES